MVFSELGPCTVCAIGNNLARKREVERQPEVVWTKFVYSFKAFGELELGEGTMPLQGAVVGVGAKIGKHVILNHNCVVDHDAIVGDYAHIGPCASLAGGVKVGDGAFIGAGARVVSGEVPPWVIVRANSVFPNDYTKGIHKLKAVE